MEHLSWSKKCTFLYVLMGAIVFLSTSPGLAEKVREFSAEQVGMQPDGKVIHSGDVYFSGEKLRMNSLSPGGPEGMIVILRRDLKQNWMLNPKAKTYFERPLDEEEFQKHLASGIKVQSEKDLGTETVNGFKCQKKEIVSSFTMMGRTITSKSTVWVSDQFDLPLRTLAENGTVTEFRNIKKGKQQDSLFEVPADYRKVAGMMELMGDERPQKRKGPPKDVKIPENIKEMLPKGFKMPSGSNP